VLSEVELVDKNFAKPGSNRGKSDFFKVDLLFENAKNQIFASSQSRFVAHPILHLWITLTIPTVERTSLMVMDLFLRSLELVMDRETLLGETLLYGSGTRTNLPARKAAGA
jgi:hypothetical protein